MASRQRVIRLLDRFVPAPLRAGGGDGLMRARIAVGASLVGGLLCLTVGALSAWALGLAPGFLWANLAAGAGILSGPLLLRRTGSIALVTHFLLTVGLVTVGALYLGSGGDNFSALYSIPIVPLFATLLGGLRTGALWGGLSALATLILVYLPLPQAAGFADFSVVDAQLQVARDVVIITVWITALGGLYDLVRNVALRDAERARTRAEESEERFYRVFAANPDAIVVAALDDGLVLECNDGFRSLCGLAHGPVAGAVRWTDAFRMDEAQRRAAHEALLEGDGAAELEVSLPGERGERRILLLSASRVELDGRPCVLATGRDLTDRKRLEEQLRQAQKMEAVGQLAGSIAHDFNNMLTVIAGYAEHLRSELGGELRDMAAEVHDAAERSASLTRQLLAFSRRQVLKPRVLDLAAMAQRLEALLQRLIGERVTVRLELDPGPAWVRADPGQLEQVIVNLAINARDAMPGGGALVVAVGSADGPGAAGKDAVCLRVRDTGVGMDESTLHRVFEPFFTTKEQDKGTGLGLSTVHGIVRQSGGEIAIASRPGRGTEVAVRLPRVAGCADSDGHGTGRPPRAAPGRTVLLVEDDPMVRRLVRRTLDGAGYRVVEAEDGAEALAVFRRDPGAVDLVLTDVMMPRKSGAELAAALGAERPELPVVFMSGHPNPREDHAARLPDDADLIHKPFSADTLRHRVARALGEPTRAAS